MPQPAALLTLQIRQHAEHGNEKALSLDPKQKLRDLIAELENENALGASDQKTVVLDQTSVGRLSRMDAMQRQAMAKANQQRRAATLQRLQTALKRIDDGEYGFCTDCGEAIETKRLELDPSVPRCMSCTRG